MADFDSDWKITGSPDPATPDPQPHQAPQAQPVQQAMPVQPQYQPVQQAVPVQPQYQQYQPGAVQPAQLNPVQPGQPQTFQQPSNAQNVQAFVPGYSYGGQQVVYQNPNYIAERDANLNELNKMINHFQSKIDLFQKYEKCKNDIYMYSRTSVAPFVWGIIVALNGLALTFSAFSSKSKDAKLGFAIASAVVILLGAALVAVFFIKKKRHAAKLEELYVQMGELSSELNIVYNGYSNCVLPPEFTDPRILYKIKALINTGRYLTIGNALNAMLAVNRAYANIQTAKGQFIKETSERFDGKPAFFNAFKYLNLR